MGSKAEWIAVLPGPGNFGSWLGFERGVAIPDAWFGDYPRPDAMVGVLAVPLKGYEYRS